MAKLKKKIKRLKSSIRKRVLGFVPQVLRIGKRALRRGTLRYGQPWFEKQFSDDADGLRAFERELLAQKLFKDRPWLTPAVERGPRCLAMPRFRDEQRLDLAAPRMNEATRLEVARQALLAAWEIFDKGYAHRDFQGENLFWVNGNLMVTDFETLEPYPPADAPAFPESYDIVARGLTSTHSKGPIGYASDHSLALQRLLGVPFDRAIASVHDVLKEHLREQSLTFKTAGERHVVRAERIYGSFVLPYLTVAAEEAQRHSARRLEKFGVGAELLRGRRLLDLGCNCGAMLFEARQFQPAVSLGIEYDAEKIEVARAVARFNGLNNIEFRAGDVDALEPETVGGTYDVVFCLAINRHVKNPERLYDFLGRITADTLFFEGNGGTSVEEVLQRLREAGFKTVDFIGMSDDDCLANNNNRPGFVARRRHVL